MREELNRIFFTYLHTRRTAIVKRTSLHLILIVKRSFGQKAVTHIVVNIVVCVADHV